jgi:hypothetical protein
MGIFKSLLAAFGLLALFFVAAPGNAQAAVMSKPGLLAQGMALTQVERLAEPARSRHCYTRMVRRCSTHYTRKCVQWGRYGKCRRWASRPVTRCYRTPKRVCYWR